MADDESIYNYYADPDNRVAAGPGRRRATRPLSTHVPVRFSPEVIAEVKAVAEDDNKTVSSWIRDVIEREVERRRPRYPMSVGYSSSAIDFIFTGFVGEAKVTGAGATVNEPVAAR